MPLFSIITVNFNTGRFLQQAIDSVLSQTYSSFEYIIIDGGSTDQSLDILRKYSNKIDYWISEPDKGIYDAMNKAINLASGELIGLLNADDYYEPDALENIAEVYRSNKTKGIYFGNDFIVQDDLSIKFKNIANKNFWKGMTIRHQAMFVHTNVYQKTGNYSCKYRWASDYDFLLRAASEKIDFIHVDKYVVNYRNTGLTSENYTSSILESWKINGSYYKKNKILHIIYGVIIIKALILHYCQKIIKFFFGDKILKRLKLFYINKVLIGEKNVIKIDL